MHVALVGGGAMALYLVKELLATQHPISITVYEAGQSVGPGMPYSDEQNAEYMLCNAFSREIPIVTQSLVTWLRSLPRRELNEWELSTADVNARAFYPRVLIGEFLQNEFMELVRSAATTRSSVTINCNSKVTDLKPDGEGNVQVETASQAEIYDHVIIATGHAWAAEPVINDVPLLSPWPYSQVTKLTSSRVGILGSSLSAIDVVVALGFARGTFKEEGQHVTWTPASDQKNFKAAMISRMGIMPEGDFYYPYPYEQLRAITSEAVQNEVADGSSGLLMRVFDLLLRELEISDPDYLNQLGDAARTVDGFAEAYFRHRQRLGGLAAVKRDFSEVRKSVRERRAIPHRYALLRAHETFDLALRALDDNDWSVFKDKLLPVFSDCYAAVPHLSVARVLAMHDAGVLALEEAGDDSLFEVSPENRIRVTTDNKVHEFDVMIDARGQTANPLSALPFPSLVSKLYNDNHAIEAPFKLPFKADESASVYCVALPQMLERHPFSQGLQNCAEVAKIVVQDIMLKRDFR
jgi:uncharacterized NAD(P)/FAD-binding protein YdhS